MCTLKVPGAQLSYEVEGSGPLLILIPGASGVREVFRQVARELSARYQVVTGRSPRFFQESTRRTSRLCSPALYRCR